MIDEYTERDLDFAAERKTDEKYKPKIFIIDIVYQNSDYNVKKKRSCNFVCDTEER